MFQEDDKILGIIIGIMLLVPLSMVLLFIIFNNRKNKLIQEQELEKKRFETELAESQIEIREETLRNISWELHDNIGQLMTLAKINLQNSQNDSTKMEETIGILGDALRELKSLSKSIHPESLKNMNILEAVHNELERFDRMNFILSTMKITGNPFDIPHKDEIMFFRIIQEFFSNTIRHSRATELNIQFQFHHPELKILVSDNGIGFNANENYQGLGLKNMNNRGALVGAEIEFSSEPEVGTQLIILKNYHEEI